MILWSLWKRTASKNASHASEPAYGLLRKSCHRHAAYPISYQPLPCPATALAGVRLRQPHHPQQRDHLGQARIGSAHTLYRCLKELAAWGYIAYAASKSPSYGSSISIHTILPKKVVPKVPANTKPVEKQFAIPPSLPDVVLFFQEKGYPPIEAQKFFNHFQSNGWKVGGKAPMPNWHAAADNWILNSHNFKKEPVQQTLNLNTPKSYEEPL